jgi:hypothetical protein
MASLDWLYVALLGVGGSIVGGAVGGWYVLRATHQQWVHDRAAARLDRSHRAASAVMAAISDLELAIVAWQKGRKDADALRDATNSFERTALVQSIALTDDELSERLNYHRLLAHKLVQAVNDKETGAPALSETVRYHADAMFHALRAHTRGEPLPRTTLHRLDDRPAGGVG